MLEGDCCVCVVIVVILDECFKDCSEWEKVLG